MVLNTALHHQVTDDGGQGGRTVGFLGESDGDTDGEEQREVVEQRATGGAHRLEERADDGCLDPAQQIVLAQSEQDAGGGQYRDRQHQALAEALQLCEAGDSSS
jgi:hypothetical protein